MGGSPRVVQYGTSNRNKIDLGTNCLDSKCRQSYSRAIRVRFKTPVQAVPQNNVKDPPVPCPMASARVPTVECSSFPGDLRRRKVVHDDDHFF